MKRSDNLEKMALGLESQIRKKIDQEGILNENETVEINVSIIVRPKFFPTSCVVRDLGDYEVRENMGIDELGFSTRVLNCLYSISTVNDLIRRTASDLLMIRNFGKVSLKEVRDKLAEFGLKLRAD